MVKKATKSAVSKKPKVKETLNEEVKTPTKKDNSKLTSLVNSLNKKFGDNAITIGKNYKENKKVKRLATGSFLLDIELGGGLPLGRFIQMSGGYSSTKTSQLMHMIREAQKAGLTCALIDAEGTSDEDYIRMFGIDYDSLLYSRPDGMEEALELMIMLQRSGDVHFIGLDSIAALVTNKENETAMEDSLRMGIPQQKLGEYTRKYMSANNRLVREGNEPCTVVAINQLREKIGGYGDPEYCVHYDTKVIFADGRSIPIGEVVKNKIEGEVLAYDEERDTFVPAKILDWRDNGVIESDREYYNIICDGVGSKNGVYSFTATYDHLVLTDTGWKPTEELNLYDKLVSSQKQVINGKLKDFLSGTFVGDCTLASKGNSASIRFKDNVNPEYSKWKASKINNLIPMREDVTSKMWVSKYTTELKDLKDKLGNRDIRFFINNFSHLGLALWYMDDGNMSEDRHCSICLARHKGDIKLFEKLKTFLDRKGLSITYSAKKGCIYFNKENTEILHEKIAEYVPKCMEYKLLPQFRGRYFDFELYNTPCTKQRLVSIKSISIASERKLRKKGRYDIKVEKYHNFLAGGTDNGVVIHNSPGGRAKDFLMSVDIRYRRGDWISQGSGDNKEIVGQVVKFKIDKNKTYKRMRTGECDFYFTDENNAGVKCFYNDNYKEVVVAGVEWGVIQRGGAWFTYKDLKFQGINPLVEAFKKDPQLIETIKEEVLNVVRTVNKIGD